MNGQFLDKRPKTSELRMLFKIVARKQRNRELFRCTSYLASPCWLPKSTLCILGHHGIHGTTKDVDVVENCSVL